MSESDENITDETESDENETDENETDENITDESESHSTMFIINQIAIDRFMLAIIIWSIINNIKFKALDQLLVILIIMVLNAQEPAEHY